MISGSVASNAGGIINPSPESEREERESFKPLRNLPEMVVIIAMGVLPLIMVANVLSRYTGWYRSPWAADIARICFIWASFIGAAIGVKYDVHIRLTLLSDKISRAYRGRFRKAVFVLTHGSVCAVGLILGVVGWSIVAVSMKRTMSVIQIPRGFVDAALPISGLLIAFYSARNLVRDLRSSALSDEE